VFKVEFRSRVFIHEFVRKLFWLCVLLLVAWVNTLVVEELAKRMEDRQLKVFASVLCCVNLVLFAVFLGSETGPH
jgi:hypothetical protein